MVNVAAAAVDEGLLPSHRKGSLRPPPPFNSPSLSPKGTGEQPLDILSYDLKLDVDFGKAYVKGRLAITVKGAPKHFSLDAAQIKINSVLVNGHPAKFAFDEKRAKLKVTGVPARESVVDIDYTKQVSDDVIFGLYKSKYGKDYILATDLEPAEARTVFPCVDEPAYKAVFRLQITTEDGLGVIANTPLASKASAGPGRTTYTFEQTPRMSTYLFFFAIGRFEERKVTTDGIDVITATRPGQADNSRVALNIAAEALGEYQRYYGVPYPLKKLHIVALPEYHTGAMENWGAISSREAYALVTEDTSFAQKNRGAMSMVHEVAHQWFGDLVTMKWWDDLWLNESFATFMSYKLTDRLRPDWEMWGIFLRDEGFLALNLDALSTTHAVHGHVRDVAESMHTFDAISYGKGGCVLRMLEAYVGEEAFRKGVSAYLKKFSFSNASGKDLWQSLGKASGLPVTRVAMEWLTKPGYPVVEASYRDGNVLLRQSRFTLSGRRAPGVWPIPVSLRANGKETSTFLDRKTGKLKARADRELLLNLDRTGFYATLYDEAGYERLAANFSRIGAHDRAGIMYDLFLFLQAGLVDPHLYSRFVELSAANPDAMVSQIVTEQLMHLTAIAGESRVIREIEPRFYPPLLSAFGYEPKQGEPPFVGATREFLTSEYASVDEPYARRMSQLFDRFSELDPNLKSAAAIGYAITNGAGAEKRLQDMAKTLEGEVDRAKIYEGLCAFREPELVEHTLELGISGQVSRSDSGYPLYLSAYNPYARDALWNWIVKRYDGMREMYAGSQQFYLYMGRAIPMCGVEREAEVRRFLSGRRLREGGSSVTRILELLHINAGLRKRLLKAQN
jgi:tricorn protease interacting factor F2/3